MYVGMVKLPSWLWVPTLKDSVKILPLARSRSQDDALPTLLHESGVPKIEVEAGLHVPKCLGSSLTCAEMCRIMPELRRDGPPGLG
jgi:hypothetical protein